MSYFLYMGAHRCGRLLHPGLPTEPHAEPCGCAALASAGLFLLNAFSMPVAYKKLGQPGPWGWGIVPGLHLFAALLVRTLQRN